MDWLIQYLISLLITDETLIDAFTTAGAKSIAYASNVESPVAVYRDFPRIAAAYPAILLFGYEDNQKSYGDLMPIFFTGRLKLEVDTKQDSNLDTDPLDTLRAIQLRCTQLIVGDPGIIPPTAGLRGQVISSTANGDPYNLNCCELHQIMPTGDLPPPEPTLFRWGATYRVTTCRTSI